VPGPWHSLEDRALAFLNGHNANLPPVALPTGAVPMPVTVTGSGNSVTSPAPSDAFSRAVLAAIRETYRTDAAMIQARDLHNADLLSGQPIPDCEVQDQISRVVWKGDEAIVLHVTGATIRKLLKQSATFTQLDNNLLNTEIEKKRVLITLGIYSDPKDSETIYVNGALMNDTTLYTIATTDFISGGDTGYANLAPPDVLPALRVRDYGNRRVRPIAGLVCAAITHQPKTARVRECADMRLSPDYFDESRQSPADATPGYSTRQHWRPSVILRNFRLVQRPFSDSEQSVQQRPYWSLRLENGDFSESGVFVKDFHKTTTSLAGISNPLVANKGTQNIGADYKLRALYDYRRGTNYLLTDMSFLYNATTTTNSKLVTSGALTLAYNVMGYEFGGTVRLPLRREKTGDTKKPSRWQRPSWLSAQYSVRYETEVIAPPPTLFAYTPVTGQVANLNLETPHVSTLYGRFGLRAEAADSYVETGVEATDAIGLLDHYLIPQNNGQPAYTCSPALSADLAPVACGNGTPPLVAVSNLPALAGPANLTVSPFQNDYLTGGFYLNILLKFPIKSRRDANRTNQSIYFTLTNKGDLYWKNPKSDTSVQTRYLDKLTPALVIPIWSGVAVSLKVDLIAFQNKVTPVHYFAMQPAISLSYTFIKRQGMGWSRALRYGAQTTMPSPAGPLH
jgi:hypothetical protein